MSVLCDRAAVRSLRSVRSAEQPALARAELVSLTTEASSAIRRSVCAGGLVDPVGAGVVDGAGPLDASSATVSDELSGADWSPTPVGFDDCSTATEPLPESPGAEID